MQRIFHSRGARVIASLAVASSGIGITTLVLSGSAAQADPAFTTSVVGVGADVTEDVFDAYSGQSGAQTNARFFLPLTSSQASGYQAIASFDANAAGSSTTVPSAITTVLGGPSFDRPNSTTQGVAALEAAVTGSLYLNSTGSFTGTPTSVTGQIAFSRAARGPKGTGTNLTWIPYGRDALGYIYFDHGTGALANLTTAQLKAIYSGTAGTIGGLTVDGCLTITGSTPRSNLETLTSVSDTVADTEATNAGCNQLFQNSGDSFYSAISSLPAGVGAVVPISVSDWIGQNNGYAVDESSSARSNGLQLGNLNGTAPFTLSGSTESANTPYYQSVAGYNIYNVVPTNSLSGFTQNAALESLFVGSGSVLCSTAAQNTLHLFGFDSLFAGEGTCGSTTQVGSA